MCRDQLTVRLATFNKSCYCNSYARNLRIQSLLYCIAAVLAGTFTTMSPAFKTGAPAQPSATAAKPQAPQKARSQPTRQVRGFVNPGAEEVSGQGSQKLRPELTDLYLNYLVLTSTQKSQVDALYNASKTYLQTFDATSPDEQVCAAAFLATSWLDEDGRECYNNKWAVRWSGRSAKKVYEAKMNWILYQWCVQ